jgi:hypothetical protein
MVPQNLRPLLEALGATPGVKKASGEVTDPQALLSSGVFARLDARHPGPYAIFLHDPLGDPGVAAYLASGTLAADSGSVLALYERQPRTVDAPPGAPDLPGLRVEGEGPMLNFVRALFSEVLVTLPGVLVLARLAQADDAVYVELSARQRDDVTVQVRKLMALVAKAAADRPAGTALGQVLGVALARAGLRYHRSQGKTPQEHLARLLSVLWASRRDLAALVPVVGKAFAGKPAAAE